MATFNGVNIFGYGKPTIIFSINPRDTQTNAYPGISHVESLDGGGRGGVTTVKGLLYGSDLLGLNAALQLFESFYDGFAYALVDTFGNNWPNVKLMRFDPTSGIMGPDTQGRYFVSYAAEFHHLSIPT